MEELLVIWGGNAKQIKIVTSNDEIDFTNMEITFFNVTDRTYTKRRSDIEVSFMKFLLPSNHKFVPMVV